MATVTLDGKPVRTSGELPAVGSRAPAFRLVGSDLEEVGLDAFRGKKKILSFVPSLDTAVCAASTRKLDEEAARLPDTVVLVISADLPFTQNRFCREEKIENVRTLSLIRGKGSAKAYGVLITDGPFAGATARAVLALDENDTILHAELVPEIGQEPDYGAAIAALRG